MVIILKNVSLIYEAFTISYIIIYKVPVSQNLQAIEKIQGKAFPETRYSFKTIAYDSIYKQFEKGS